MADAAILFAAMICLDEDEDDFPEPPPKKKRKLPKCWERPFLKHRRDPTCENVFTVQRALREVSIKKNTCYGIIHAFYLICRQPFADFNNLIPLSVHILY